DVYILILESFGDFEIVGIFPCFDCRKYWHALLLCNFEALLHCGYRYLIHFGTSAYVMKELKRAFYLFVSGVFCKDIRRTAEKSISACSVACGHGYKRKAVLIEIVVCYGLTQSVVTYKSQ